jgi:hypothetical protein
VKRERVEATPRNEVRAVVAESWFLRQLLYDYQIV